LFEAGLKQVCSAGLRPAFDLLATRSRKSATKFAARFAACYNNGMQPILFSLTDSRRGSPDPNRPTRRGIFSKLTLTHIPEPNPINFVHVSGRSLYIDWRMVVVVGRNVLHHVKREGELSWRGNVRGNISKGKCLDPAPTTAAEPFRVCTYYRLTERRTTRS